MNRRDFLRLAAATPILAVPACRRVIDRVNRGEVLEMSVFLGAREFELGPNRIPMALVAKNNSPIEATEGTVRLKGAGTDDREGTLQLRRFLIPPPSQHEHTELPIVFEAPFFYDCTLELPVKGLWQLDVEVTTKEEKYRGRVALEVRERTSPGPGDAAQPLKTPTDNDSMGNAFLCTREPPCGMHSVSLDQALVEDKPTVLVVATPRFCTSRLCGPVVDEVMSLRDSYRDVTFVHTEVYRDAEASQYARIMQDWHLETEPWIFVIDQQASIRARFEGPITAPQIEESLRSI